MKLVLLAILAFLSQSTLAHECVEKMHRQEPTTHILQVCGWKAVVGWIIEFRKALIVHLNSKKTDAQSEQEFDLAKDKKTEQIVATMQHYLDAMHQWHETRKIFTARLLVNVFGPNCRPFLTLPEMLITPFLSSYMKETEIQFDGLDNYGILCPDAIYFVRSISEDDILRPLKTKIHKLPLEKDDEFKQYVDLHMKMMRRLDVFEGNSNRITKPNMEFKKEDIDSNDLKTNVSQQIIDLNLSFEAAKGANYERGALDQDVDADHLGHKLDISTSKEQELPNRKKSIEATLAKIKKKDLLNDVKIFENEEQALLRTKYTLKKFFTQTEGFVKKHKHSHHSLKDLLIWENQVFPDDINVNPMDVFDEIPEAMKYIKAKYTDFNYDSLGEHIEILQQQKNKSLYNREFETKFDTYQMFMKYKSNFDKGYFLENKEKEYEPNSDEYETNKIKITSIDIRIKMILRQNSPKAKLKEKLQIENLDSIRSPNPHLRSDFWTRLYREALIVRNQKFSQEDDYTSNFMDELVFEKDEFKKFAENRNKHSDLANILEANAARAEGFEAILKDEPDADLDHDKLVDNIFLFQKQQNEKDTQIREKEIDISHSKMNQMGKWTNIKDQISLLAKKLPAVKNKLKIYQEIKSNPTLEDLGLDTFTQKDNYTFYSNVYKNILQGLVETPSTWKYKNRIGTFEVIENDKVDIAPEYEIERKNPALLSEQIAYNELSPAGDYEDFDRKKLVHRLRKPPTIQIRIKRDLEADLKALGEVGDAISTAMDIGAHQFCNGQSLEDCAGIQLFPDVIPVTKLHQFSEQGLDEIFNHDTMFNNYLSSQVLRLCVFSQVHYMRLEKYTDYSLKREELISLCYRSMQRTLSSFNENHLMSTNFPKSWILRNPYNTQSAKKALQKGLIDFESLKKVYEDENNQIRLNSKVKIEALVSDSKKEEYKNKQKRIDNLILDRQAQIFQNRDTSIDDQLTLQRIKERRQTEALDSGYLGGGQSDFNYKIKRRKNKKLKERIQRIKDRRKIREKEKMEAQNLESMRKNSKRRRKRQQTIIKTFEQHQVELLPDISGFGKDDGYGAESDDSDNYSYGLYPPHSKDWRPMLAPTSSNVSQVSHFLEEVGNQQNLQILRGNLRDGPKRVKWTDGIEIAKPRIIHHRKQDTQILPDMLNQMGLELMTSQNLRKKKVEQILGQNPKPIPSSTDPTTLYKSFKNKGRFQFFKLKDAIQKLRKIPHTKLIFKDGKLHRVADHGDKLQHLRSTSINILSDQFGNRKSEHLKSEPPLGHLTDNQKPVKPLSLSVPTSNHQNPISKEDLRKPIGQSSQRTPAPSKKLPDQGPPLQGKKYTHTKAPEELDDVYTTDRVDNDEDELIQSIVDYYKLQDKKHVKNAVLHRDQYIIVPQPINDYREQTAEDHNVYADNSLLNAEEAELINRTDVMMEMLKDSRGIEMFNIELDNGIFQSDEDEDRLTVDDNFNITYTIDRTLNDNLTQRLLHKLQNEEAFLQKDDNVVQSMYNVSRQPEYSQNINSLLEFIADYSDYEECMENVHNPEFFLSQALNRNPFNSWLLRKEGVVYQVFDEMFYVPDNYELTHRPMKEWMFFPLSSICNGILNHSFVTLGSIQQASRPLAPNFEALNFRVRINDLFEKDFEPKFEYLLESNSIVRTKGPSQNHTRAKSFFINDLRFDTTNLGLSEVQNLKDINDSGDQFTKFKRSKAILKRKKVTFKDQLKHEDVTVLGSTVRSSNSSSPATSPRLSTHQNGRSVVIPTPPNSTSRRDHRQNLPSFSMLNHHVEDWTTRSEYPHDHWSEDTEYYDDSQLSQDPYHRTISQPRYNTGKCKSLSDFECASLYFNKLREISTHKTDPRKEWANERLNNLQKNLTIGNCDSITESAFENFGLMMSRIAEHAQAYGVNSELVINEPFVLDTITKFLPRSIEAFFERHCISITMSKMMGILDSSKPGFDSIKQSPFRKMGRVILFLPKNIEEDQSQPPQNPTKVRQVDKGLIDKDLQIQLQKRVMGDHFNEYALNIKDMHHSSLLDQSGLGVKQDNILIFNHFFPDFTVRAFMNSAIVYYQELMRFFFVNMNIGDLEDGAQD